MGLLSLTLHVSPTFNPSIFTLPTHRCRRPPSLAVRATSLSGAPQPLLQVNDLKAKILESGVEILHGVNLTVNEGEVHAIMGKNGSGKSTFAKVLVGHPDYEVTGGSVVFKGENLLEMEPEERSLAGLFMSFQSPVEIPGVSNDEFLVMAYNARRRKLGLPELGPLECFSYLMEKLQLVNMKPDFLNRNVNEGFSGGERKRNEILQLAVLFKSLVSLLFWVQTWLFWTKLILDWMLMHSEMLQVQSIVY
ncbi:ABC transporter I member 6, chloroplastic [Stylosanthes scabra]|uniref:ABC transporter I member 6, chloroplastic n=1 Tax=Stylosanthes scabra TaxID=79078 RepID=A0ABU6YQS1_9FABA|nr:ABC transporter I member 6, chloroplastic [Stylosanthes scabra]